MTLRSFPAAATAFLALAAVLSLLLPTLLAENNSQSNSNQLQFQWQMISAINFTSQIHLHPHILLLVTVPWCGESRSLMREISLQLAKAEQKYSSLKLMVVYRNIDKVLADSLGSEEELTVLCYHHAVRYKYQGSLRVPDIVSSVDYLVSLVPEELPLRKISNLEDMEKFLASTDKAILLLETCGWTSQVQAEISSNKTVQALQVFRDLNKETNRTRVPGGKKYSEHDARSEMTICEDEEGCDGGSRWIGEFGTENGTSFYRNKDMSTSFVTPCSFTEYKKFESFFSKFTALARDSYLPPQRQRYALLSDRSLLSPLSIEVSDLWSLIISYAGCPGCTMEVKEETILKDALEMNDQPVIELLEDENGLGPSLPIDKPSIILFVDRQSDSKETVKHSQEALIAFKEFARQNWKLNQTLGQNSVRLRKSLHTEKGSAGTYKNSRVVLSSGSAKITDTLSVVIIKDGKYVALDSKASESQSGSLHEILTDLVRQKKTSKLSSLATEAGFQLLSDDIDIKITDILSHQVGTHNIDPVRTSDEVADSTIINSPSDSEGELLQPANIDPSFGENKQKLSMSFARKHDGLVDSQQSFNDPEVVSSILTASKFQASVKVDESESLEQDHDSFTGSFYYSDGNNKFLRSLTNDLEVPSLVIIDPISQEHYVFSGETTLNLSSISTFIDRFRNGSLIPYQRSGPLRKAIEMSHPPFVNLDFQEKDFIPSINTETFSELVIGASQSDSYNSTNAWHKDIVVLFSNSWCGFCQRMELVVREAYRALKGYVNLVKCDSESKDPCSEDNFKNFISKLPAIYSIDCTLNDCGWILKSTGHREAYPTLLLFPAKKKTVISFEGNMIVTDIINFISNHGDSSEHLTKQKGASWEEGGSHDNHDSSRDVVSKRLSPEMTEVTFMPDKKEALRNLVVGSFLVASDRLNGANPFSESKILIVSVNPDVGFQGLIINKPISWNQLSGSENVEFLKEAQISFGGPVIQEGRPLVSLTRSASSNQHPQVMPGVYFLDQLATIDKIAEIQAGNQAASDYLFFWGYSGWEWEQLYNEITEGAWKLHEGSIEDLQWP